MRDKDVRYELYLVRHGQTLSNIGKHPDSDSLFDRCNSPLSEYGEKEAVLVGERFANLRFDHVFVSPWTRTLTTAQEIITRQPRNWAGYAELLPNLIEISCPTFSHPYSMAEVRATAGVSYPVFLAPGIKEEINLCPPTGDNSEEEEFLRAKSVIDHFDSRFENGEKILAVSHAGAISLIAEHLLQMPRPRLKINFHNTSVTKFVFHTEESQKPLRLAYLNDCSHLYADFRERFE